MYEFTVSLSSFVRLNFNVRGKSDTNHAISYHDDASVMYTCAHHTLVRLTHL